MSQSEGAPVAPVCPVCRTVVDTASPHVVCSDCGVPHHTACWLRNVRCTTPGCAGLALPAGPKPVVAAAPPIAAPLPVAEGVPAAARLRPMGLLEIVDQSFRLYRSNLRLFFGIVAVVALPAAALLAVPGVRWVALVLAIPAGLATYGALTKAVSDRYLGRESSLADSYRFAGSRFFPFLLTLIVTYLFILSPVLVSMIATAAGGDDEAAMIIGMIFTLLAMVAEFLFGIWCTFVAQVFVVEDKRYFQSIWRSRFLVGQGTWLSVAAVSIVMQVLLSVVFYAILIPVVLLMGDSALVSPEALFTGFAGSVIGVIGLLLLAAMGSLLTPLPLVCFILLYYDSRIRKEGFDLQVLAQEMGLGAPTAALPAAPPAEVPPGGSGA